jgi:phage shock protein PspC (stress-responsive transcriptional regulator)
MVRWRSARHSVDMNPTPSPTSLRPRRLTRSTTDRKVGGVAGGLAAYLGADPLAVRLGFAIGSLFSGAGLIAYILMLAFVPEQDGSAVAAQPAAA